MTHFWLRAESRTDEARTPLLPEGAAALIAAGHRISVETAPRRLLADDGFRAAGCNIVAEGSWPQAPRDAVILGLKELPEAETPLVHRHVMFGHAYKGQPGAAALLRRFRDGGGALLDMEYLTDAEGRRVAAFGYWAGYAGAAVALLALAAARDARPMAPLSAWSDRAAMTDAVAVALGSARPRVLVIGALGRVGRGAADLCEAVGLQVTGWDQAETAGGGPFPEVLAHEVFLNCILARPGTPVFVAAGDGDRPRALRVIGDIACDPDNSFSPIKVNRRVTSWAAPARRVHATPPLDVVAIDNLPSLLPRESSEDFAGQLLPHLIDFDSDPDRVWARARGCFDAAPG